MVRNIILWLKKKEIEKVRESLLELEKIQSIAENPNFQIIKEIMFQEKQLAEVKTHFTTGKITQKEKKWAPAGTKYFGKYYFKLTLDNGAKIFCYRNKLIDYNSETDSSEMFNIMVENAILFTVLYEYEYRKDSTSGLDAIKIKVVNRE